MSCECAMSRQAADIYSYGTVNSTSLSIAFMEFLSDGDSNALKQLWLSYGWEDVSALWGSKRMVPTFKQDKAVIEKWPDFQVGMGDVEADWYYLSGHHGRQFAADLGPDDDMLDHFNTHENCGFFNEVYHSGRWEEADAQNPYEHIRDLDVFMRTGNENYNGMASETNPLYGTCHDNCRGIILVGCRGLAYKSARRMYNEYFPNAVVIGPVSKESTAIVKLLKVFKGYGRDFFVDPTQYDFEEVVKKLNPFLAMYDRMALQYGGEMWMPIKGGKVKCIGIEDDITDDIA